MNLRRPAIAIALLALPGAAPAGQLGGDAALSVSPWRVAAALLLCLAVGAAAIFVLRRQLGVQRLLGSSGGSGPRVRIVEQRLLGPQRSITLVEIDERVFVVLLAPGAASLVPLRETGSASPATAEPAHSVP